MDSFSKAKLTTLLELLQYRASSLSGGAHNTAFTYLKDGEQVSGSITFAELDSQARNIAAHLQGVTKRGDCVLLIFPPSIEYIAAFFGCVYAGVIAVPALPPSNARTFPRLQLIAQDAQARIALTLGDIEDKIADFKMDSDSFVNQLSWLSTDRVADASAHWAAPSIQPSDIAFLQYTSGSTGSPKGVMVSHGNILANVRVIHSAFGMKPSDVIVSWLPPHHDMGLIGKILYPVYSGCNCVQFPPAAFLMRPLRWLKLLSDYRARITGAPNFAYDLCVDKITDEQKQALDLSHLEFALNGAEPIRAGSLRRFSDAFSQCGFRPESITPVYGLAESTLMVSANIHREQNRSWNTVSVSKEALAVDRIEIGAAQADAVEIVSTGLAVCNDHHFVIAALPTFTLQPDKAVGEIWVHGPSVAHGYWNRPDESQSTFSGKLANRDELYLRTGDLGFIDNGELYVTGRIKDLMIINGRNVYPQDVETTIEQIDPAFRANGCAVFSLEENDASGLVIIQEIESRKEASVEALTTKVKIELAEQHEITHVAAILLVKAGRIPRTSSGKIQRSQSRKLFLADAFSPIWAWTNTQEGNTPKEFVAPQSETERHLASIWEGILGRKNISATDNFFELGGHSLLATSLISKIRTAFAIDLPLRGLFEAPALAALAAQIDAARQTQDGLSALAIVPVERGHALPLSFAQQRLWFLDQLQPGSAFYNIPGTLRLAGRLDITIFGRVLNEITRRHESLRTRFTLNDGTPVQNIDPVLELTLSVADLSDLGPSEREARARQLEQIEAKTPFDLSTGPLIRVGLLRLADQEHIALFTLHHIVSDGWSMGVLLNEVAALYAAYVQQLPSPLPELAVQYADFSHWQRQWLAGDTLARQLDYWTAQLGGAPTLLPLPTDRPRPAQQSYRGANLPFTVPAHTTTALHALNQQTQATLFMTLTAVFNILLSRYSGQTDICIGTPIANRNRAETEALIGFFVNTLVLRNQVNPDSSFNALLQQVRTTALDAYAHQDVPFEQLVDALRPERSMSHAPLFQVVLVLQNAPMDRLELPGLALLPVVTGNATAKFDLTLNFVEAEGQLSGSFEYNTDLFDAATILRMAGHFTRLLEAVVADPACRIGDLPMLDEAERRQLLVDWNDTVAAYPLTGAQTLTLHQLFEAQAARTPHHVAVAFEEVTLSYAELNTRANQLAHYLRGAGVGAEDLVGICVERSPEMIVGLLGVLKAGGAYVPLDPAYPQERLTYMLTDARPAIVLTQQAVQERVNLAGIRHLCLDSDVALLAQQPDHNPVPVNVPGDLAYVIYTSGSTGKPKGALLQHDNVLRLFDATAPWFGFDEHDSWSLFHSFAFDFSVWEIWGALLHGGKLVVVPHSVTRSPGEFHALLVREGVTVLNQTPSAFQQLIAADVALGHPDTLKLRYVIFGGEALNTAALEPWFRARGDAVPQLINMYGITETTVHVTYQALSAAGTVSAASVGRPIPDLSTYILDSDQNPVPVGVAGELYIGGAGLARGYLHRPDLTAEKFIPHPYSTTPGARLYRSGDLARYLPDGNIDYLGRIDSQVKIRGFRIELGEIEAALSAVAGVKEAVVLAREDVPGDKRLVAYLIAHEAQVVPDALQLRAALLQSLPDYMVPAYFVALAVMPLTSNGKVDRRALPAPDTSRSAAGYVAPGTPTEEVLAQIWAEVLKRDKVGIHDNFFELGGHSLLATSLISKIRTAFAIELPLRDLFEAPALAALARQIDAARQTQRGLSAPAIVPVARGDSSPLSFAQQRLWFIDQLQPGSAFYNIPGTLRLAGQFDITIFGRVLNEITRRHESLRTRFMVNDGTPVQSIDPVLELTLSVIDLSDLAPSERKVRAHQLEQTEAKTPFDLSAGPLIRVGLLRLADEDHIALFTLHHIVSDGWSMGVLLNEVETLYAAYVQHLPSPLPDLAVQYADFSHWQRQWLAGDTLARQLDYWTTQLGGVPTLLQLPTDRPRPAQQSYRGANLPFTVPAHTTTALHALNQATQTTLFMTLTAVFNILLSRYSGQTDICIGTPIANRNRAETEALIGFFVNTLVLRNQVNPDSSFNALLQQVRTTALDAYAHQDVPFEQLVNALKPERSMTHAPLFQIMLALQNAPTNRLELPGLALLPVATENATTKFDLTLNFVEAEGQLSGSFEYSTDLFDSSTIERMAGHYTRLLDAITIDPGCRISDLQMMGEAERTQILVDWNDTSTDCPQDKTIHQLFEEQVQANPQAIAVVFEEQELTYGELNARANQLAHHLRTSGVGPDVLVGICVERSIEMIVGLLGILKAGGAYVPLDPAYPKDRLAYMLDDARPVVVLTQSRLLANLPDTDIPTFCLDTGQTALADHSADSPESATQPGHSAYVIYTSGSTGRPKGVMIEHRSLVNLAIAQADKLRARACKTVLQFASLNFDMSVEEIFPSLLIGARLIIRPTGLFVPDVDFLQLICRHEIHALNLPTAFWHEWVRLLAVGNSTVPDCVKIVAVGGEKVNAEQYRQWAELPATKSVAWINAYGPTEATVNASCIEAGYGQLFDDNDIPIGRPLPNTLIYVLDPDLNPVPVGLPGELHIAGAGLARGYLNRPELTADKFIPNPFSQISGARMYKSGDLARYLPDGNIEYLGRVDTQVKIRGFRIELGEIEAALTAQPGICEAIVLAREDAAGDKRLVAYVVKQAGSNENEADASTLRAALLQSLPDYMVPAHYVTLEKLPLTPNGKIDRKALPAPDMARSEAGYVAPRTPTEEILAGIWADVLKLDKVGIHDNFFDLGGHSLLATQLISKIRAALRIELPLRTLFEAPTTAALSQRIAFERQEPQEQPGLSLPAMLPIPRDNALPLSFAQQRLWFLDQFESDKANYNMAGAIRLAGQLDVTALRRTLNEIVRRHEALRTRFVTLDGTPVQVIAPALELMLPVTDLSALPHGEREARMQWLAQDEAQTPFDLSTGPLIRAGLIKLDDTHHIITLTLHHIVSDGWSIGVLIQEVAVLYSAYVQDLPSPMPELAIQYADYAHWQRHWLSGVVLETQLDYWKAQLSGAPTLLALPTDRPRPAVQTYRGASHAFTIAAAATAKITALSKQTQSTLFMTLTAAFNVLLSRYTGQEDICIGTPIANRQRAEVEPLIGFFVNTLVLRTQIAGQQTFTDLLQQVRHNALGAYAHQDVPFEQLVEALKPERHTSHAPLFQVMIVLQNAPMEELRLPGLTLQPITTEHTTAKFDLTLNFVEAEGQLSGSFEYNTDLFDAATILRMAGHFTRLLEAVVADPACRIGDLPMLDEAERRQLLIDWNDTATAYPKEQTIHQLFEAQAAAAPEAVAAVFAETGLSYGELNARANQLAHHLRSLGVGPDVLVGICAGRSLDMIVGLLAILKAGGAYLPLDPAYPQERLAYMLDDAKPAVLLTQQAVTGVLPVCDVPVFCLDGDWSSLSAYSRANPLPQACPASLAYVIYTSGSTGRPKGIVVTHQNVVRLVMQTGYFTLDAQNRVLQFAPVSFDASTFEIWGALLHRACLVVLPPGKLSVDELGAAITAQRVDTLWLTAALFNQMVEHQLPALVSMRHVLAGGEALSVHHVQQFIDAGTSTLLTNGYGPTESTTFAVCYPIPFQSGLASSVPIGRPIANTRIYILDAALQPVPVGVAGELHIAGDGLARGYLNRPGLTAVSFIPDPFGDVPGARMYKSGDLACYLPDGNISYLGRIDSQVKIRGFRIELGEIEAALSAVAGVKEAVVLAREDVPGDKRLAAYIVLHDEAAEAADATVLRAALTQTLPDYMVPAHFVFLDHLPLTSNGKVDRRALPAPDTSRSAAGYVAPGTPTEEVLAQIWAEVLKRDKVGIHDNFFELGGHSLLATSLISKIRTAFAIELPLRDLFEAPALAALARQIDAARQTQRGLSAPAIVPVARGDSSPLSFAQQRLWFIDQFDPGSALYNIPFAVRLQGDVDIAAFTRTLNEVVRRHEILRTSFARIDGNPAQRIAPSQELILPMTDLSDLPPAERTTRAQWLAQDEAQTPFDLSTGPLIRTRLLRLGSAEHVVLFTLHHIVSDGWSMGVLLNEVAALYAAYVQQLPSPLPELAVQYADFSHWQRQWLAGDTLARQLDYWTAQLGGAPTLLPLPTDRPRPAQQSYRGANLPFTVPAHTTTALHALNQQTQATLFMTLTAVFNILLSRYSGQTDICIGTPIANRNRAETEALIGFFVNTLVLRNQVNPDSSFNALLQQVRTTALDAYAHQDVPFEQLVDALKPERSMSHAPLFQVVLALQNAPMERLDLPGLALLPVATGNATAKFDLLLNFVEAEGQLSGSFEYNTDLFDAATILRMAGHFTRLLEAVVADPACRVGDLPMLSDAEHTQLLAWNATAVAYPDDQTIHGLFEAQSLRTPHQPAVISNARSLTYAELQAHAKQLGRQLLSLGAQPNQLIAVVMEKGWEQVTATLGILYSGAAYLPLDPELPAAQLHQILEHADVSIILTQSLLAQHTDWPDCVITCIHMDQQEWHDDEDNSPVASSSPDNVAYVIYAQDETDLLKGIAIDHRGIVNTLTDINRRFDITASDRVFAVSPFGVDLSVFDFFGSLAAGSAIVIPDHAARHHPAHWCEMIEEHHVTVWNSAPDLLGRLLDHAESNAIYPATLRLAMLSGDAIPQALPLRLKSMLPQAQLISLNGAVETSIWSLFYPVDDVQNDERYIVCGKPLSNQRLYVLDAMLNAVPVGVIGELCIGGTGLARGYWRDEERTRANFIEHPSTGERLYKTGNRTRHVANGNIELIRPALPSSEKAHAEVAYAAPQTPVEETLVAIWAEVLERDQVGIHDNLFDIGGHSLLATILISRIREDFDIELPLSTLFEQPTIAVVAAFIEAQIMREIESMSDDEADSLASAMNDQ